jgi:predicted GNAT family acetyltransferase
MTIIAPASLSVFPSAFPSVDDDGIPAHAIRRDDAAYDSWPGMATTGQLGAVPPEVDSMAIPRLLDDATTRQLRRWVNHLYKQLDADFPRFGVREDCERIIDELERRRRQELEGSTPSRRRDAFRDNPLNGRFELFQNGMLAGYVTYSMRAGKLRLHRTVVAEAFEGAGVEQLLIRNVLLNAHKRRLSSLPYCAQFQAFLAGNPQYRALLGV